ncbi:MAG: gliding motility protein GldN [Flavobacteriales bacterium]|nr:gliding motility protein GldN [Flavobacteriales bacterium]
MKILKIALTGLALLASSTMFAQTNVLDYNSSPTPLDGHAFIKHHDYQNRVLDYPFVREDDILWSKTYIQRIDLRQKKNHPLYFPQYPVKLGSGQVRMNMADNLLKAVLEDQSLVAYEDEYFDEVKSVVAINKLLFSITEEEYEDIDTGELISELDTVRVESKDIKEFLVVEDRFFDKKRSVLDVRILGLCPVAEIMNKETYEMEKVKLFWVWLPEARQTLANATVYNTSNSVERLTYDEFLQKRLFASVITKETNLYDRSIFEYKKDRMQQLLEADRIKNDIRNMESDLWEY